MGEPVLLGVCWCRMHACRALCAVPFVLREVGLGRGGHRHSHARLAGRPRERQYRAWRAMPAPPDDWQRQARGTCIGVPRRCPWCPWLGNEVPACKPASLPRPCMPSCCELLCCCCAWPPARKQVSKPASQPAGHARWTWAQLVAGRREGGLEVCFHAPVGLGRC